MPRPFTIPPSWRVVELDRKMPSSYIEAAWLDSYFLSGGKCLRLPDQDEFPELCYEHFAQFFIEHEQPPYRRLVWFDSDLDSWNAGKGRRGFAWVRTGGIIGPNPPLEVMDWFLMSMS